MNRTNTEQFLLNNNDALNRKHGLELEQAILLVQSKLLHEPDDEHTILDNVNW